MTAQTLTLVDFLHARIAEDEAVARDAISHGEGCLDWADSGDPTDRHIARWDPARALAECAVKRRIVDVHSYWHVCVRGAFGEAELGACPTLIALAMPYTSHPGFLPEWRP